MKNYGTHTTISESTTTRLEYFALRAGIVVVTGRVNGIVVAIAAGDRVVEEVHQACEGVHSDALFVVRLNLKVERGEI